MTRTSNVFHRLAVIGAGNMGSGIAQKMASEGFDVVLVDVAEDNVERGIATIGSTLAQGVERGVFNQLQADATLKRVEGTTDWDRLADVDLVVEAVFEDLEVKRKVFQRLETVCREDAILATNTSSFLVEDVAAGLEHPGRVVGLHYFYHPAKNRLVEVVAGRGSTEVAVRGAWSLQEQIGKTPIHSADASGFIVNRYFVPWLNEAVRLLEEGVADIPTIEAASKQAFGVGMGPFELMNVTGVPIALHAATTLGERFGPFHAPTDRLRQQVDSGENWPLEGEADESKQEAVRDRMLAVVFHVAARLVDEGVGSIEDTDIGARVGLRWPRGPFQLMNRIGVEQSLALVEGVASRFGLEAPALLREQARSGGRFRFRLVRVDVADGVATLTLNRPDAMNALNEDVVAQLEEAFDQVAKDDAVRGIVIAGAGKAFIAGADIRFFVRNIDTGRLERIVEFTRAGHRLLDSIDNCPKPVVARLHGLALGGGLELALACDRIVASRKATVAFPETGIGIYPGLGGTQRTTRRVGAALAKALIFTGRMLDADEAQSIGLIDAVVPGERLDDTIRGVLEAGGEVPARDDDRTLDHQWAKLKRLFEAHTAEQLRTGQLDMADDPVAMKVVKQVAYKAPLALGLAERLIDEGAELPLEDGLRLELEHLTEIFGTEDAYEGLSSVGRRRPQFKGR